jgi:hypothetical protein
MSDMGQNATLVAISADATRVLSGSNDWTIKLWDVTTGAQLRTFEGHGATVTSVALSADGTRVLSGAYDPKPKLWDANTGTLLRSFGPHHAYSVAFSPNGEHVLSGGDNRLMLWDASTGALLRTLNSNGVLSVAFSPDGARLIWGSADKTVKLWGTPTGALLRAFEGHSGPVNSVAFSADGRRIVSASTDATTRIWDAATGEQFAAFIPGPGGKSLAITPVGFFASSHSGDESIAIVRGVEVTTIDQAYQSLFNPDLVREALAGDPNREVQEAAKVISLEKVLDSGPAPVVALASPGAANESATDLATITAHTEDRGKGIGRIEWRVNGTTVAVAPKRSGKGPVYTATQQLALGPGDNTVEVVAYNASNLLASRPARTTLRVTGPTDKTKPKLHILAIGINAYVAKGWTPPGKESLGFGPLGLAVKDAMAFGAAMNQAADGLYGEIRVTLALDRDATRDKLEKTVAKIAREIHPRDSFILFAAGHGTSDNGRFYFIPQDYQSGPGNLENGAIGQTRVQDWLANRIKAKRAIVLLDTCESGALVAGYARSRTDAPASEAAVGRLHEATGRPVLTAAAAGQFAHEGLITPSGDRHGVFTWAVLDALT